ncbi:MAG TPA: hypothetical protein VMA35_07575 [Candidatus Sulfopaludibacter sp.]|nr:hypothetical protein [Candidatus Sulfopaludibacter sp.]
MAFFLGGGGVLIKAFKASLNETPLRLGNIVSASFFFSFARFDFATISLSSPRDVRWFWFHKAIQLPQCPVPSNHLPIG